MRKSLFILFTFTLVLLLTNLIFSQLSPCYAYDKAASKTFSLDAVAGFPQFLGLELSYLKWGPFVPGISFGAAPIQPIVNQIMNLGSVPVQFSGSDSYRLVPTATVDLYSFTLYMKYFFPDSHFFADLIFSNVSFNATISADLKDETTGGNLSSAISGTAKMRQMMLGIAFGYQFNFNSSFFFETACGAGYLFPPSFAVSLGGTAAQIADIIPNGAQSVNDATTSIESTVSSALSAYSSTIKVAPFGFFNVGFAF